MANPSEMPPTILYHATTFRAAQLIMDSEGIDPSASERYEHVFLFDAFANATAFVNDYRDNFRDTGPVILEVRGQGLTLTPDPQRPSLPGAWRSADLIEGDRIGAIWEPAGTGWQRTWQRADLAVVCASGRDRPAAIAVDQ
jgi:hypothetical protein